LNVIKEKEFYRGGKEEWCGERDEEFCEGGDKEFL